MPIIVLLSAVSFPLIPISVNAAEHAQNADGEQLALSSTSVKLNQLLIGLEPGQSEAEVAALIAERGLKLVKQWPSFGSVLVELDGALTSFVERSQLRTSSVAEQQAFAALEAEQQSLEQLAGVRYVSFNGRISAATKPSAIPSGDQWSFQNSTDSPTPPLVEPLPNDPEFTNQWALNIIRVVDSWNISQGDPKVVVAVIDSGYNLTHPDIENSSLWENPIEKAGIPGVDDDNNGFVDDINGWDWVENDNVMNDTFGHGSHVGATIAAKTNNQLGISGMGRNIKVMALRILDGRGDGQISDLVDALDYALTKRVRIVNLSLVASSDYAALADAISGVSDEIMIVAATGNVSSRVYWPAAYPRTVAIAATDSNDTYASFSNHGPEVDLAAPGVDILSADESIGYIDSTGTSMATPHVSALAALICSLRPDFTNEDILDVMKESAVDINVSEHRGRDEYIGHGRVDVYQALLSASAGLRLNSTQDSDRFTFARRLVEYNIRLQTPSNKDDDGEPVMGAAIHYKLIPLGSTPNPEPPIGGRVLTGADGVADITFLAPVATGSYVLRTQVGQESVDFSLIVYPIVSDVGLEISSDVVEAGMGQTYVTVEAFDSLGARLTEPIPLQLQTDAGRFQYGQQTLNLIMNNGIYTTTYFASPQSGTSVITATVAGVLSDAGEIQIGPSTPNTLDLTSDVSTLQTGQGIDSAKLSVRVRDIYGNPISSAFPVNLYTNIGTISPAIFQSSDDGAMVAILKVPPDMTEEVTIWAVLPNTNLIAKLVLQMLSEKFTLLPVMVNN